MPHRLITIGISHFCDKARWALQRAGLPFVEEPHMPLLHIPSVKRAGGGRSTPLLITEDGQHLPDSTDILRWIDAHPDARWRPYQVAGTAAAEVAELEDRFDERLGPHTRRIGYHYVLGQRSLTISTLKDSGPAWEGRLLALSFYPARAFLRWAMRIDAAGVERSTGVVDEIFSEVSARLADGRTWLAGDVMSAADITFASLAAPVLLPPEYPGGLPAIEAAPAPMQQLVRRLRETPAGALGLRLYSLRSELG